MKRKIYRNLLVQYKGGGYDGCFWEWNFFMFDGRGKFHNLVSTGRLGIKTSEEAKAVITANEDLYKYNLKSKKSIKEFSENTNPRLVDIVGNRVNAIYKKVAITFDCDECGDSVVLDEYQTNGYPCMFHDPNDYTGNGGVGIIQYGKLCEDCYYTHDCGYCGSFNEPEENNVDDEGRCIHCTEKEPVIEYFPLNKFGKINKIAIHLKEPDEYELERAKEKALSDRFELICVYGKVGA